MCSHPCRKLLGVPSLHEHRPRAGKLADQAFSTTDARDDASARYTLHDVFAVPGYEMAVVDDVFFAFHKLRPHCQWCGVLDEGEDKAELTSFRMMAPKLANHRIPVPLILYTKSPSPENMALLNP